MVDWLVDWRCFSSVCVCVGLSPFGELCATLVRVVGRKAYFTATPSNSWLAGLVEDHVWWLLVVGWPARGLYALGGRSRSGKAADSFRQIDDFFAI